MPIGTVGGPVSFVSTLFFSPKTRGKAPIAEREVGKARSMA
jgi:hypothetical protein